ncbi:MAG: hypothetical protein KJ994_01440 [Candidatus Omnitrophica bacterium]|nr:hypothetical protein [Candidatus Omnitrophota bacterium]
MKAVVVAALIFGYTSVSAAIGTQQIVISDADAGWIGNKIFHNECGGKNEYLISWNDGEDFISLGIGHFIWYPDNKIGPFDESFPDLLEFIKENRRELPDWLRDPETSRCPWQSKDELLRDLQSPKVRELRTFLIETKDLQLIFIANRLKNALPKILKTAPEEARFRIEYQFYRMASTPAGVYALVDYVNFSGEGVLATERYKGKGWGLLQVLERMNGTEDGPRAIREFVQAAKETLAERVRNSPPERNERRWTRGWRNRLNTYIDAIDNNPGYPRI